MSPARITSIEENADSLRIMMPVERAGCVSLFLGVWLVGWLAGEVSAISALFRFESWLNFGVLFLLVWLVGWTAGGVVAAAFFVMTLDGREIVTFTAEEIDRRAEAFGRGLNWKYAMSDVTNLRPTGGDDGVKSFISFDHKGKTIRFGTNLNETEAERAVEAVWARYPALMPRVERVRRGEAARGVAAEAAGYSGAEPEESDAAAASPA